MNVTTIRKQLFADLADTSKSEGLSDFNTMMDKMARGREDRKNEQ